jgi:hypothetical protein
MSLVVKSIKLHSSGLDTTLTGLKTDAFIFLICDVISSIPEYAAAVSTGLPLHGNKNQVKDLDQFAEAYILKTIMESTKTTDFRKKLLVIELTNFPYITCYIDSRDQNVLNSVDQFSKDVMNIWNNPKDGYVGTICTNMNMPNTGLKLVPIPK